MLPLRWMHCTSTLLRYCMNREAQQRAQLPAPSVGNRVALLVNGNEAFPALQRALSAARQSIRWQVMLFSPDAAGMALAELLAAAARRGVTVQLSFDVRQVTSGTPAGRLPVAERARRAAKVDRMLALLVEAGVAVRSTSPGSLAKHPQADQPDWETIRQHLCITANHYDHRKILVIDDLLAFIGGMNVGDHYLYLAAPKDGEPQHWLDSMVQIEGPVVAAIAAEFDGMWQAVGGQALMPAQLPAAVGSTEVQYLRQHPGIPQIGARFFTLVTSAQQEIWIASPFVSYRPALAALAQAARRGVQINLITPGESQVMEVSKWVFAGSAPELVRVGVQLLYNDHRMAHTKLMVVDRRWTMAGSLNMNYRSFLHDSESAVVIDSEEFARLVLDRVFLPYRAMSQPASPKHLFPNPLRWLIRPFS